MSTEDASALNDDMPTRITRALDDMLRDAVEQCGPEELAEVFARCRHLVNEWQRIANAWEPALDGQDSPNQ